MRTVTTGNIKKGQVLLVGMKPLSERDENASRLHRKPLLSSLVGMKPLSERDENILKSILAEAHSITSRNEATL
mgnify:CR=1 FL=1